MSNREWYRKKPKVATLQDILGLEQPVQKVVSEDRSLFGEGDELDYDSGRGKHLSLADKHSMARSVPVLSDSSREEDAWDDFYND